MNNNNDFLEKIVDIMVTRKMSNCVEKILNNNNVPIAQDGGSQISNIPFDSIVTCIMIIITIILFYNTISRYLEINNSYNQKILNDKCSLTPGNYVCSVKNNGEMKCKKKR
jgi:hypothetical protein